MAIRKIYTTFSIVQLVSIGVIALAAEFMFGGSRGTENIGSAIILIFLVVPASALLSCIYVVTAPFYVIRNKPRGKRLALVIASFIASALIAGLVAAFIIAYNTTKHTA